MSSKGKLLNRIINIVILVLVAILLFFAIMSLTSLKKGYNNFFGTAVLAVKSESMVGKEKDNFNKGDLIFVKILKGEQKSELNIDDVITFKTNDIIDEKEVLNTHRIIEKGTVNGIVYYKTQGDNSPNPDSGVLKADDVIGIYKSKLPGIGNINLVLTSKWGFFGVVLVPCFLAVLYCVYKVIIAAKAVTKEKGDEDFAAKKEDLRAQILEEMRREEATKQPPTPENKEQ